MEDRWTAYIRELQKKPDIENPWLKGKSRDEHESREVAESGDQVWEFQDRHSQDV